MHWKRWYRHGDPNFVKTHYHGKSNSYLYHTWEDIKQRTNNKNNPSYYRYGGRGITLYKPWAENYTKFEEYIVKNLGEKPENFTLDRIDNNKGYIPNNIRWASRSVQSYNQSKRRTNTSGFTGVTWDKKANKWLAQITINYKNIFIGYFDELENAGYVRSQFAEQLRNK